MKIFVITHKKANIPRLPCYIPLLVGAVNHPELKNLYLSDDSGENISYLNDSYCELTGLYWMWKNCKEDIVGLVHYRRYFAHVSGLRVKSRYFAVNPGKCFHILSENEILSILKDCDIVVKQSEKYESTEAVFRKHLHVGNTQWDRLENIIKNKYSDYYGIFKKNAKSARHINCNMFIGKKKIIARYCMWLFPILYDMNDIQIEQTGKRYCDREVGYFSEILFGVWLDYNGINYKIVDAVNTESKDIEDAVLSLSKLPGFLLRNYTPMPMKSVLKKLKR